MYQRTMSARAIAYVIDKMHTQKIDIRYDGLGILEKAHLSGKKLSILCSHVNMDDIMILDKTLRDNLGKSDYPVFIMRNDISLQGISKSLCMHYFENHFKSIPIDQSDMRSLKKIMPNLKDAFNERKHIVLFPGTTRKQGYVNGYTELTTALYALYLKKSGLAKDHLFLPAGITYEPHEQGKSATLRFGEPLEINDATGHKELGIKIRDIIANLTGFNLEDMVDSEEVRKYIMTKDRVVEE